MTNHTEAAGRPEFAVSVPAAAIHPLSSRSNRPGADCGAILVLVHRMDNRGCGLAKILISHPDRFNLDCPVIGAGGPCPKTP